MNKDIIENFIGIFPNTASKEYCDVIISHFEDISEIQDRRMGGGRIWSREDEGSAPMDKEHDTCSLGFPPEDTMFDGRIIDEGEAILLDRERILLERFNTMIWNCYERYAKKYGALKSIAQHKVSPYVRIQKYKPSQGYHVWHSDASNIECSRRMLTVILYLNTIEEGGETEFLYQSTRIPPVQGTLILFPPWWIYPHRGNPPLKENKYIITVWIEFIE